MKKIFVYFFIFFLLQPAFCLFEQRDVGVRAIGMGGCYTAAADDLYSIYYNPAGLTEIESLEAGFNYYAVFPFLEGMDSIGFYNFALAYPLPYIGSLGFAYDYFGFNLYNEQNIIFTHGFQIYRRFKLGYNLKIMLLSIENFGRAAAFGLDAGFIADMLDNLSVGIFAKNLNGPRIGKSSIEIPFYGAIGIKYTPFLGLTLLAELTKQADGEIDFKFGQEFRAFKFLHIRGGIQTGTIKYSLGIGVNLKWVYIDYAFLNNIVLGPQHLFSIMFKLQETERDVFREVIKERKKKVITIPETKEEIFVGEKININTATAEELQELPRIGPKTAEKIIQHRNEVGYFKKIEDIMNVKGIGPKTFAKMRNMITVGEKELPIIPIKKEIFDINKASLADLIDNGIPSVIGKRIINYRETAGGIKSVEELKTIEGMTPEIFEKLKALTVKPKEVEPPKVAPPKEVKPPEEPKLKFDINTADLVAFAKIGIPPREAKLIIGYRNKVGIIKSIDEISKIEGVSRETINKIKDAIEK